MQGMEDLFFMIFFPGDRELLLFITHDRADMPEEYETIRLHFTLREGFHLQVL